MAFHRRHRTCYHLLSLAKIRRTAPGPATQFGTRNPNALTTQGLRWLYETTVTKRHDIYETVVSVAGFSPQDRQLLLTDVRPPKRFHWPGLDDRNRRRMRPTGPSCVCKSTIFGPLESWHMSRTVGSMGVVGSACILHIYAAARHIGGAKARCGSVLRSCRREFVHVTG